jgi:hypothetical protein
VRTLSAPLWLLLAISGAAPGDPGPMTAEGVEACMTANVPATVRAQSVELVTTDKGGSIRTIAGRIYASQEEDTTRRRVRAVLQIDGPHDLAGAAYLVRETGIASRDGIYFYLPTVGSARKVTGASATNSLLGTDFSFQEFKLLLNSFQDVTVALESSGQLDGRPVYVATFQPREPDPEASHARAWIDQKSCVPLKVDFYRGDTVRKQALVKPDAVKSAGDAWYPGEIDMRDLSAGTHSVLRATILESTTTVPSAVFDVTRFQRRFEGS